MNWGAIGAIGEILGAIGVIVTLGYLAVQIRQNTKVSKAATAQQMTDKWVQINLFMADHPELSIRVADSSRLDPQETIAALAVWRALFHQWSNNYYQHSQGVLDRELFETTLREISTYARHPLAGKAIRHAWNSERFMYSQAFSDFMDQIINEQSAQPEA